MSIRAYRVNKIEYKEDPTININSEWEAIEKYMGEQEGIIELPIEQIKEIISNKAISEEARERFKEDLEWALKMGEDHIVYHTW